MPLHVLLAVAATTATPLKHPSAAKTHAATAQTRVKPAVDPMEAMASMLKLVDKFFPAGPEPEPTRLALARQATVAMFPKGTIAQAMTGLVDRTVDRVLDMSEADFAAIVPPAKDKNGKVKKRRRRVPNLYASCSRKKSRTLMPRWPRYALSPARLSPSSGMSPNPNIAKAWRARSLEV